MFFTLPMTLKLMLFTLFAVCVVQVVMTIIFWSFMSKMTRIINEKTLRPEDESYMAKMARLVSKDKKDTIEIYGTDAPDEEI